MPFGFGDLTDQAHHLVSTGDLAGAQRLLSDALSEADPRPANATADMAEAASLHARVLVALGEPHSARGWAAYAYAAQTRLHGRSDPRTVAAAATLAAVLHRVGSQSRAARLYQDVIVELTAQEGPESLRVLAAHADLATVEYARGQCRTARYRLRDAWDLHREVYGEGHPSGIKMLARLGAMQRDCGEFAEAHDNLALARELCRQHLPVDDPLAVQVAALARAAANPDHVCADEPPDAPVVPSARTPSYGEAPAYDPDQPEPDEPLAVPTPRQPADDPAGTDEAWWPPDEPAGWSADPTRPGWQQPDDPPTRPVDEPGAAAQATWPPDEPDATGPAASAWTPDEPNATGPAARPGEPGAAGPAEWPPDEPRRAGQAAWPPEEPSGARPAAWPPDEPGAAGQAAWHRNEPGGARTSAWPPEERGAADEPGGAGAAGWPPERPGDEVPGGPLPPPGGSVPPAVVAMAGAEEADGVHRVRRGADPVEPYQPSRLLPVPVRRPSTPAGRRLLPIVVGGVVVVLLGAAAVIAGVAGVDGDDPPRATPSSAPGSATTGGTPGPSDTPSPSRSAPTVAAATPGTPPSGVSLRDNRDNVTLRWTYPAGGEGPVVVSGGRAGQPKSALTDLPAGTNSFIIYGLNSSLDYCFTVAVVWSTDTIAAADEVCTRRR
ncbi:tetratricopeptide repeat protein [Micromonospora costi]|uniref:Tetratricopeptide repeat protein n=1 Tax=Micromonospora costi TaxID=1530042 RepID=A0A3B0AAW0_9ACTN|nr:tetratricopeptide repeat protein [Micromonospora costi]RKN57681.1 tetratricopeptide repeat protein [Micromonospora costi]